MIPVIYRIMSVCDNIYYLQFSSFFFSNTAANDDGCCCCYCCDGCCCCCRNCCCWGGVLLKMIANAVAFFFSNYTADDEGWIICRTKAEAEGSRSGKIVGLSVLLLWTLTLNNADNEVANTVAVVGGVADIDDGWSAGHLPKIRSRYYSNENMVVYALAVTVGVVNTDGRYTHSLYIYISSY